MSARSVESRQRCYMARKLAGQCVKCPTILPPDRDSVVCRPCQDRDSANWRKRHGSKRRDHA